MENNTRFIWAHTPVFLKKINEDSILCCHTENNKVIVCLDSDPCKIITSRSLNEIENMLTKEKFFRCNRGYLVNICSINQISPKMGEIILTNGLKVPVSRKRKDELCRLLNTCMYI